MTTSDTLRVQHFPCAWLHTPASTAVHTTRYTHSNTHNTAQLTQHMCSTTQHNTMSCATPRRAAPRSTPHHTTTPQRTFSLVFNLVDYVAWNLVWQLVCFSQVPRMTSKYIFSSSAEQTGACTRNLRSTASRRIRSRPSCRQHRERLGCLHTRPFRNGVLDRIPLARQPLVPTQS